jgi:hypothetical protein
MNITFRIDGDDEDHIVRDMLNSSEAGDVEIVVGLDGGNKFVFWGVSLEQLRANEEFQHKVEYFAKVFCLELHWQTADFEMIELIIWPRGGFYGNE